MSTSNILKLSNIIENNYDFDNIIISNYEKNNYYSYNNFTNLNKNQQIDFKLLDGPPFISGNDIKTANLHMGHCLISYLKSVYHIYNFMLKNNVDFMTSSDNHGLPTELLICKYLGLNSTQDIKTIGLKKFNETGINLINMFEKSWYEIYKILGRDYSKYHYRTSSYDYMCHIWKMLYKINKKGLLYSGIKILPYSCKLETPLSNFEANENYKEIKTNTYYVYCKILDNSEKFQNTGFIFWTTTAWTIPFNVMLCLNPNGEYYKIDLQNDKKNIFDEYLDNKNTNITENAIRYAIVEKHYIKKFKHITEEFIGLGKDLKNIQYLPPFENFNHLNKNNILFKTVTDDYVDLESKNGTGIVHLSPAFGVDDYRICNGYGIVNNNNILDFCPIDDKGNYKTSDIFNGLNIFEVEEILIPYIYDKIIKKEVIMHQYPHSPRTNDPLIYKACRSYFIDVKSIKDKLLALNDKINWIPDHIKKGRFGKWLENAEDWCISRNRFFGTPLNIWINKETGKYIVIKNLEELEAKVGKYLVHNLHPENIYDIKFFDNELLEYENVKLTFDCWFESGCSCLYNNYYDYQPYDLCIEGIDQCRGYFYTSLILSAIIKDDVPFKNCICTGLIMDKYGKKLSKSAGNYEPPNTYIEKFGSDCLRLYLISSVCVNGENLKFNIDDIKPIKQKLIQFINCVKFLYDYDRKYNKKTIFINNEKVEHVLNFKKVKEISKDEVKNIFDLWILSKLDELIINLNNNMKSYNLKSTANLITDFIENLTNIYVKLNRNRFKSNDKIIFDVLKFVIHKFIIVCTPFMPMLCEYIYNLYSVEFNSIKYNDYVKNIGFYDEKINKKFDKFIEILKSLRNVRHNKGNLDKMIYEINIKSLKNIDFIEEFEEIIKTELNIYNIKHETITEKDFDGDFSIIYNYPEIGKDFKQYTKFIKSYKFNKDILYDYYIGNINNLEIKLEKENKNIILNDKYIKEINPVFNIKVEKNKINNDKKEENINNLIQYKDYMFEIIDKETEEIKEFDKCKELIGKIQEMRKQQNINVYDNIEITVFSPFIEIYKKHYDYLKKQLLVDIKFNYDKEEIITIFTI